MIKIGELIYCSLNYKHMAHSATAVQYCENKTVICQFPLRKNYQVIKSILCPEVISYVHILLSYYAAICQKKFTHVISHSKKQYIM